MKWIFGISVGKIILEAKWLSGNGRHRAYYGFRLGPFLIVWTRWKRENRGRDEEAP